MNILLAGNGKMAKAIQDACLAEANPPVHFAKFKACGFDYSNPNFGTPIGIHVGSGRQLFEFIDFCEERKMPIIQATTKMNVVVPRDRNVAIINAPNLAIPMIRFMAFFPKFARAIGLGMSFNIVESHQMGKADKSGTARTIAETLGMNTEHITSIREPATQQALGVPEGHLGGHALHYFIFNGHGVEVKVSTRVLGRNAYALGALMIAKALEKLKEPPQRGFYELKDMLHLFPENLFKES